MASPLLEQRAAPLDGRRPADRARWSTATATRLAQVFANLLTNAAKYTPTGRRTIDVAARARRDGVVASRARQRHRHRARDAARVFDLFVQEPQALDRSQGGLGLGLAIVRSAGRAARRHGRRAQRRARARAASSSCALPLPSTRRRDAAPTAGDASGKPRRTSAAPLRILVVDDNEDAAGAARRAARATRANAVASRTTGRRRSARLDDVPPDLALLDIGLPVMDGYELAGAPARSSRVRSRLIALTGYGQDADHARSHQAGFEAHLVKPVDVARLRDAIEGVR